LAGWWLVLLAAYLVLISSVTLQEVVVGAAIAALASAVPAMTIRGFGPVAPPRGPRWRHLARLPWDLARDVVALASRLLALRRHVGRIEERPLPAAGDPTAVRAYGVLVLSLTPGSYVMDVMVDADRSPGDVRLHRLGARAGVGRVVGEGTGE